MLLDKFGQLLNTGGVVWGTTELGLQAIRQFDNGNGPKIIARSPLGFGFGTQRVAAALKGTLGVVKNAGATLGSIGYVVSAFTYSNQILSGQTVSTATHVNFGISTALYGGAALLAGTAAAPFVAGAALVYGAAQLGS